MAILLSRHIPHLLPCPVTKTEYLTPKERMRYRVILEHVRQRIELDELVAEGKKYEAYLSCGMIIQELALNRSFFRATDPHPILNWSAFYDPPVMPVTSENIRKVFEFRPPVVSRNRSN